MQRPHGKEMTVSNEVIVATLKLADARLRELEFAVSCLLENSRYGRVTDGGFNGQRSKREIFAELLATQGFEALFETGTCIGETTGYMALASGLPVFSCEASTRYFSIAKMRLQDVPGVYVAWEDSRSFLRRLGATELSGKRSFFYLDAHWFEEMPLKEEIEIISSLWSDFVILVDDFEVPGDAGYGFENDGEGNLLDVISFAETFKKCGLTAFYPTLPSSEDTGTKRGTLVLVKESEAGRLSGLKSLRRADFAPR